jgi:hypothetical protein
MNAYKNIHTKAFYASLTVLLLTLIAGCAQRVTAVTQAEPVLEFLYATNLEIRNCDCPEDMQSDLASQIEIEKSIQIEDQAVNQSGEVLSPIPEEIKDQLLAEIELAYEPVYQEKAQELEGIELVIPLDKIHVYRIEWTKYSYQSAVSFWVDSRNYTTAYTYELVVPEEKGFAQRSCTA